MPRMTAAFVVRSPNVPSKSNFTVHLNRLRTPRGRGLGSCRLCRLLHGESCRAARRVRRRSSSVGAIALHARDVALVTLEVIPYHIPLSPQNACSTIRLRERAHGARGLTSFGGRCIYLFIYSSCCRNGVTWPMGVTVRATVRAMRARGLPTAVGVARWRPPTTLGARCHPNLTPGGALSSAYLSLRWSPSVASGADITRSLPDVMPTQWRVEWTALAGCGWRYPSLGAMSDRRPRAHVQVNCIYIP